MADSPFGSENQPVYHEVPQNRIMATKIVGICSIVMVILAFIFCLVTGAKNHTFYLLACNLVISSFVGVVSTWWYRNGDLSADKYWYMILIGVVIIFQCLTTDIYVFNVHSSDTPLTTAAPVTTAAAFGG